MQEKRILLISGAMGAGKTSVAKVLESRFIFKRVSTSGYLLRRKSNLETSGVRLQLQDLGDQLDLETNYRWVLDDVASPMIAEHPDISSWLLDAVRKPKQIEHFRAKFGTQIRHAHLRAPEGTLELRYNKRIDINDTPYSEAIMHPNEASARSLEKIADVVLDTSTFSSSTLALSILALWES
ncbi:hypothetical protein [Xanthomonas arboricola]|uniref:hypothetical protein n=1 Tax=Xanthomonas arboricola TaxID=56448 RepID=UPI0011B00771|nr:hypothetical protein [Xanthomonas arboricola]MBB6572602.1 adenylosuccinate synthase [Xanthomonas arboricola]